MAAGSASAIDSSASSPGRSARARSDRSIGVAAVSASISAAIAITASSRRSRLRSREREIPRLGDEVLLPEAVVLLGMRHLEAGLLINPAGRLELALRPQRELAVAGVAREAD